MRFFLSFIFFVSYLFGLNISLSNTKVANGQTLLLKFEQEKNITYKNVIFNKKKFHIFANLYGKHGFYALVPVSYYAKKQNNRLVVEYVENLKNKTQSFNIKVIDGEYKKESISVDSSKVSPKSKEVLKRISSEYKEAMKIYNTITPRSYIDGDFILPLNSAITSDFGKARIYNNTLKGYHGGTDFRAKTGTKIVASNRGKVVLAKDRFYSGGTVVIDHGEGIYSCYFHMSKFFVKKGQIVKKGEAIGLSGQSGRVTGPHLHFGIRISGVQVDPLQFIRVLKEEM